MPSREPEEAPLFSKKINSSHLALSLSSETRRLQPAKVCGAPRSCPSGRHTGPVRALAFEIRSRSHPFAARTRGSPCAAAAAALRPDARRQAGPRGRAPEEGGDSASAPGSRRRPCLSVRRGRASRGRCCPLGLLFLFPFRSPHLGRGSLQTPSRRRLPTLRGHTVFSATRAAPAQTPLFASDAVSPHSLGTGARCWARRSRQAAGRTRGREPDARPRSARARAAPP